MQWKMEKLNMFLVTFFFCLTIFYAKQSVSKFGAHKIGISIRRDMSKNKLMFPSVTICSGFRSDEIPVKLVKEANETEIILNSKQMENLTYHRKEFITFFTLAYDDDFSKNLLDDDTLWSEEFHEFWGGRCWTFHPIKESEPGEINSMIFGLSNPRDRNVWACNLTHVTEECARIMGIFVHERNAFLYNKAQEFVGRAYFLPKLGKKLKYAMNLNEVTKFNIPNDPCQEGSTVAQWKQCIRDYYDWKAQCQRPWTIQNSRQLRERFTSMEHHLWWDIDQVTVAETGCLKPCHFLQYQLKENIFDFDGIPYDMFPEGSNTDYAVQLYFLDSSRTIYEDYEAFDVFSLIGEIGGALGLFLGWSCFQLLHRCASFMRTRLSYHLGTTNFDHKCCNDRDIVK